MLHALCSLAARASFVDWLLLFAFLLFSLYLMGTWTYDHFTRRGIPSTRPRVPFVGDTGFAFLGLRPLPHVVLELYSQCAGHSALGFFQFRTPMLLLRDPDVIKMVTIKLLDSFANHRGVINMDSDPMFGKNLLMLKDGTWREMRKTLSPAFTTSKIKGMFPLIVRCSQQMAIHLKETYSASAAGGRQEALEIDVKDLFSRMATDVIGSAAFGVGCDSLKDPENRFFQMGKALTEFKLSRLLTLSGWVLAPGLMKILKARLLDPLAVSFFTSVVNETIAEREQENIFRPDMIQLLMQARDGEIKMDADDEHETEKIDASRKKLTEEDIVAQAVIFFFAGFETVSTALCFASLALSRHPEIQRRLQNEIDDVMERTGGQLCYEAVQGMKYLDMVISESLRLFPAASATDRECCADVDLPTPHGPLRARKGDFLLLPIIALHRDPQHWPQPEKFDPERFKEENRKDINPYAYMPFGIGPRLCIGQRLALLELKLALVMLLANFNLQPSTKTKFPIQYEKGFNMKVKGGFWCKLFPRST